MADLIRATEREYRKLGRLTVEAEFGPYTELLGDGASFESVRVDTGGRASRSAEAVGANASTVGSDVEFLEGQDNPSSADGQKSIAHELADVVQREAGPQQDDHDDEVPS